MITLSIAGRQIDANEQESVLDALLRSGIEVPHACRGGVCGACTMVCTSGELPPVSQDGLREVERAQGMFLACQCRPQGNLELRMPDDDARVAATVVEHTQLSESIIRIRLAPVDPIDYMAGQYIAVQREDGLTRSYSIASVPGDPWIELHVRRVGKGRMSNWLHDEVAVGTALTLLRPRGTCCYPTSEPDAPLLLVGVGCGLAPIWGIVRDALEHGHRGPITLMHAGASPASLYLDEQLRELAQRHPQLQLRMVVLRGAELDPQRLEQGSVVTLAGSVIENSTNPEAWLCFVCGDPEIVKALKFELFMAGAASSRIFADAFALTPSLGSCLSEVA